MNSSIILFELYLGYSFISTGLSSLSRSIFVSGNSKFKTQTPFLYLVIFDFNKFDNLSFVTISLEIIHQNINLSSTFNFHKIISSTSL